MPFVQFHKWNALVTQEFLAQGDLEKQEFGHLISPAAGFDRNAQTPQAVHGFTNFFIKFLSLPLFEKLDELSKIGWVVPEVAPSEAAAAASDDTGGGGGEDEKAPAVDNNPEEDAREGEEAKDKEGKLEEEKLEEEEEEEGGGRGRVLEWRWKWGKRGRQRRRVRSGGQRVCGRGPVQVLEKLEGKRGRVGEPSPAATGPAATGPAATGPAATGATATGAAAASSSSSSSAHFNPTFPVLFTPTPPLHPGVARPAETATQGFQFQKPGRRRRRRSGAAVPAAPSFPTARTFRTLRRTSHFAPTPSSSKPPHLNAGGATDAVTTLAVVVVVVTDTTSHQYCLC